MRNKATLFAAALAVASLYFGGTAANAAPVGGLKPAVNVERSALQQVDWRPYRHCHRRYGRRWCHGGRRYGYYGYNPGFSIYVGPRHRHHHFRRHRHHRH